MPNVSDTIVAKPRAIDGKSAARKVRAEGLVPAVVYGPNREQSFLALDPKTFNLQRQQYGSSHIYNVAPEGGSNFKVLIREVQQHPLTDLLLHVDLYALDMTQSIRVDVAVEIEGKPIGLIDGGLLQQVLRRVQVECLPTNIPRKLTVDVSNLRIGDSVHLSDLKLPEGVKLISRADDAIATVVQVEEEVAGAAAAVTVEGATGAAAPAAAAAPAEGAAADKGKAAAGAKEQKK